MPTDVFIIDVDLAKPIEEIINEELAIVNKETEERVTQAIDMAKEVQQVKTDRDNRLAAQQQLWVDIMEKAHQAMSAGGLGASTQQLADIYGNHTTLSGFLAKMRQFLKTKGNVHRMEKHNKNKITYYSLVDLTPT